MHTCSHSVHLKKRGLKLVDSSVPCGAADISMLEDLGSSLGPPLSGIVKQCCKSLPLLLFVKNKRNKEKKASGNSGTMQVPHPRNVTMVAKKEKQKCRVFEDYTVEGTY